MITGKGTTGPVGAVLARCEANDDDARLRIAKGADGAVPPIGMFDDTLLPQGDEAWT
jgi:hypothetical protein